MRIFLVSIAAAVGLSLHGVVLVYAAVGATMLFAAWPQIVHVLEGRLEAATSSNPVPSTRFPKLSVALSRSIPFGMAGLFHLIYFQSNVAALIFLKDGQSAGVYSAAFGVVAAIYLLPSVLYQKFLLPKLHRWSAHDKPMFAAAFKYGSLVMVLLGLAAAALIWVCSEVVISSLFGGRYAESIWLLKLLSLSIPFMFLSHSSGAVLIGAATAKAKTCLMGGVAVLNIGICLLLIPRHGAVGAAIASIASNFLLAALYSTFAVGALRKSSTSLHAR